MISRVIALAIDNDRNRIYYSDLNRQTISSVNFNGTDIKDVVTGMCNNY